MINTKDCNFILSTNQPFHHNLYLSSGLYHSIGIEMRRMIPPKFLIHFILMQIL